jgi:hypothetical protein
LIEFDVKFYSNDQDVERNHVALGFRMFEEGKWIEPVGGEKKGAEANVHRLL